MDNLKEATIKRCQLLLKHFQTEDYDPVLVTTAEVFRSLKLQSKVKIKPVVACSQLGFHEASASEILKILESQ